MKTINQTKAGTIPVWLGIIIILMAAVVIILLVLGTKYPELIPLSSGKPAEVTTEEQQEVFSYIGRITEINPGRIVFMAQAVKNYLDKDTTITALLTEETQYLRVTVPKVLPEKLEEGKETSLFTRENISVSDLNVGDEITAISAADVRGKTEFPAARIEIIIAK